MYIHVIFNPNQVKKPQGNKVVQYFKILNSVIRNYKKNNAWNIKRLVDNSVVPVNQRNSVLEGESQNLRLG